MVLGFPTLLPNNRQTCADGPACIAHRGASHRVPENTMAAVERALELGVDAVEVDVRRTRDGALVLMHDTTLVRTTNASRVYPDRAPWRVHDFTLDELERLDAGSWKSKRHAGEPVPQLQHALEMVIRARKGLLIEVKTPELYPGIVQDIATALRTAMTMPRVDPGDPRRGLVVQSFNFAAMKELKTRAPEIPVGLLGTPATGHLPVLASWADQVNPHHARIGAGYVDRLRELGLRCQVWTCDQSIHMNRALKLGVDGVITNRPTTFLRHRTNSVVGRAVSR